MKTKVFTYSKILVALGISASVFFTLNNVRAKSSHVTQDVGSGVIDWTTDSITVTGSGAIPSDKNGAQGRLLGERAAIVDAYRQMAEVVNGVRVDSQTIVKDFVTESDEIKTSVNGFIKGARRGEKRITTDGAVEYDLSVQLYGASGLADAIDLDKHIIRKNNKRDSLFRNYHKMFAMLPGKGSNFFTIADNPAIDMNNCLQCHKPHSMPDNLNNSTNVIEEPNTTNTGSTEAITGVVIDATGLNLVPAMDPAVFDMDMKQVYIGKWNIDPDYVINYGIIGYFTDLEEAKKDARVGKNPIIIKANSLKGVTDIILEAESSTNLMAKDSVNKFLEKYAVNVVM
jgi:hypothetical protein